MDFGERSPIVKAMTPKNIAPESRVGELISKMRGRMDMRFFLHQNRWYACIENNLF